jgi:hypothetical protein
MEHSRLRINLDLSKHCIQTEIRRLHQRAVSDYFKAKARQRDALEPLIEAIRIALETLDFGYLRGAYPSLAGGTNAVVALEIKGPRLAVVIDGLEVRTQRSTQGPARQPARGSGSADKSSQS